MSFADFTDVAYGTGRDLDQFTRDLIAAKEANDRLADRKKEVDAAHKEKWADLYDEARKARDHFDDLKTQARTKITGSHAVAGVGKVTIVPGTETTTLEVDHDGLIDYLREHQPGILNQFTRQVVTRKAASVRITR